MDAVNISVNGPQTFGTVTGTTGEYRIDGMPTGTYTVTATKTGYRSNSIDVFVKDDGTFTKGDVALTPQ